MPLSPGYLKGDVKITRNTNGYSAAATFKLPSRKGVTEAAPLTYLGLEVATNPSITNEGLDQSITMLLDHAETETGHYRINRLEEEPRASGQLRWVARSAEQITELEAFICRRRGRLVGFWLPTWGFEVQLREDIQENSHQLITSPNSYADDVLRTYLLWLKDGSYQLFQAQFVDFDNQGNQIHRATLPFAQDIQASNVVHGCLMEAMRFDSDQINITRASRKKALMTVSTIEIPAPLEQPID